VALFDLRSLEVIAFIRRRILRQFCPTGYAVFIPFFVTPTARSTVHTLLLLVIDDLGKQYRIKPPASQKQLRCNGIPRR